MYIYIYTSISSCSYIYIFYFSFHASLLSDCKILYQTRLGGGVTFKPYPPVPSPPRVCDVTAA